VARLPPLEHRGYTAGYYMQAFGSWSNPHADKLHRWSQCRASRCTSLRIMQLSKIEHAPNTDHASSFGSLSGAEPPRSGYQTLWDVLLSHPGSRAGVLNSSHEHSIVTSLRNAWSSDTWEDHVGALGSSIQEYDHSTYNQVWSYSSISVGFGHVVVLLQGNKRCAVCSRMIGTRWIWRHPLATVWRNPSYVERPCDR